MSGIVIGTGEIANSKYIKRWINLIDISSKSEDFYLLLLPKKFSGKLSLSWNITTTKEMSSVHENWVLLESQYIKYLDRKEPVNIFEGD